MVILSRLSDAKLSYARYRNNGIKRGRIGFVWCPPWKVVVGFVRLLLGFVRISGYEALG